MRRGLVFGKYMPLHRGHQFVIDRAFAECDDVTIVVYDNAPEGDYPAMPVSLRVQWLETLYPQAETIVAVQDPVAPNGSDDERFAKAYADQLRALGHYDRVFTSEPQYAEFARLLDAEHIIVDTERNSVPISGTEIRSDLYRYRGWIDPRVYSTLIRKVVFVGTESTGKSTLAERMAAEYDTLWVHEYGRELWEAQNLQGSFADHLRMAERQYERERRMSYHARRYLFCDTNPWTTLMWSLNTYGMADSRLHRLVENSLHEYIWVLCDNDFGWVQDGTRELEGARSVMFQRFQREQLMAMNIPFFVVDGDLNHRAHRVSTILDNVLQPVTSLRAS